jgi:uncharacterized membrane protein YphA (DoxX/SURF4 family)
MLRIGQLLYGLALIVYGIQHFYFGTFRDVFFPPWELPLLMIWAYLFGIYLTASGVLIILGRNVRNTALWLGGVLLFFFFFLQIPHLLFVQPNKVFHLGLWVGALKELALGGGALVIAGAIPMDKPETSPIRKAINALVPFGSLFFCFTMISFGISHFLYAEFVVSIVPEWIGDRAFWSYFGGVALIGAGICIALDIRLRAMALLLGIMIFAWFWMLHLPAATSDPIGQRGNQLASAFDALAFSGIAFTIAFGLAKQKWIEIIDSIT